MHVAVSYAALSRLSACLPVKLTVTAAIWPSAAAAAPGWQTWLIIIITVHAAVAELELQFVLLSCVGLL